MTGDRELVSAEELDAMSPDERAAAVNASVVTDPSQLPERIRARVFATGERLAEHLRPSRTGL